MRAPRNQSKKGPVLGVELRVTETQSESDNRQVLTIQRIITIHQGSPCRLGSILYCQSLVTPATAEHDESRAKEKPQDGRPSGKSITADRP